MADRPIGHHHSEYESFQSWVRQLGSQLEHDEHGDSEGDAAEQLLGEIEKLISHDIEDG